METELCNMCMVTDTKGRVLVQERLSKPSNPWSGLTFSGEHVEQKDSVKGKVKWMMLDEMLAGSLAPNMTKYFAVFQNKKLPKPTPFSNKVFLY